MSMPQADPPRTTLHPAEIRANLESVRAGASEVLRGRALLRRVDDALELLDRAIGQLGDLDRRAGVREDSIPRRLADGLARRWREVRRPSHAIDRPDARREALSVLVAALLAGAALALYFWNVTDYDQLHQVSDFLQGAEGLLTVVVIIAAWSYSTWRFERARRIEAAIESIDRCRALILIIDAHALAKDFSRYWDPRRAPDADAVDGLRREETIEYLAIGARISKLVAQIAASYGGAIHDHAVIAAIDSVSQLALSIERNALAKQEMIARATATRAAGSGA